MKNLCGPIDKTDLNIPIKDIIINGNWNLSNISFELLNSLLRNIMATPLPNNFTKKDTMTQGVTSSGLFATKSCYYLINPSSPHKLDFEWIWDLKCPNNIKFFFWKCMYNHIPCRAYLSHIGMNINKTCTIYRNNEENA